MKRKKKKTTLKQMLVLDPACLLYLDNFEEHIQNELGWLLVRFPDPLLDVAIKVKFGTFFPKERGRRG